MVDWVKIPSNGEINIRSFRLLSEWLIWLTYRKIIKSEQHNQPIQLNQLKKWHICVLGNNI